MSSANFECLYVGVDGLDVSFRGALAKAALETLEVARNEAQQSSEPVLCRIGSLDAHVAETGARGGYRYRFDTGEDGEVWFVKHDERPDEWNLRVSVKSLALMIFGYAGARNRLFERIESMGAAVEAESVGRFDIAADIRCNEFQLDPAQFVAHSHSEVDAQRDPDDGFREHYAGRRPTSVTVGKMPGRQVIVYDKRREAVQKRKWHWFDCWGFDWRSNDEPVWRFEVRAGKRHLKDEWDVTSFSELEAKAPEIVGCAMEQIRYLDPADLQANISRRRSHQVWVKCRELLLAKLHSLGGAPSGAPPGARLAGGRIEKKAIYLSQLVGLSAPYAAVHNHDPRHPEITIAAIAANIRSAIERDRNRYFDRVDKARKRFALMPDSHTVAPPKETQRN